MLLRVGRVTHLDVREIENPPAQLTIDRDLPQRRREGVGVRERQAVEVVAMGRTEQHDALDGRTVGSQLAEGATGDRSGVDVAGVRRDQRARATGQPGLGLGFIQVAAHRRPQLECRVRIEEAADGCGTEA